MPDFAASDTNRSTAYGRTGNAYDVRFSPGGSSGGTVTAVTANLAVLGNGTDTGNSIRMPSSTSSVVGVFPTRGLVSIAGIAPLDWLLDNTGPIARNVTDAAIALSAMAGEDPLDPVTIGSVSKAQPGPYTQYLKADALQGKRFGVSAFMMKETGGSGLRAETRAAFLKAIEGLKSAGATVVFDESILPESFPALIRKVATILRRTITGQKLLRSLAHVRCRRTAGSAAARIARPDGRIRLGFRRWWCKGDFMRAGCRSGWRFRRGRGAMGIYWVGLLRMSRRRIIGGHRCWWSGGCWGRGERAELRNECARVKSGHVRQATHLSREAVFRPFEEVGHLHNPYCER
jgi:Asp-tRNA(Asn)/Glu-tRNA(Gln) amidotransferase A subunit family amidase